MIPLLTASDLETNPSFARLWEYVTTELLEDDGSLRNGEEERARRWWGARRRARMRMRTEGKVKGEEKGGDVGGGEGGRYSHDDGEDDGVRADEDDEDGEDNDETKDTKEQKEKRSSLRFEEHLRAVRLDKVKRHILRDVLDGLADLDLSEPEDHGEGEGGGDVAGAARAARQSYQSHGAEKASRSRIPMRASPSITQAGSRTTSKAGSATSQVLDPVMNTNPDPDPDSDSQGPTATNGRKTSDEYDDVANRSSSAVRHYSYLPSSLRELVRVIAAYLHVRLDGLGTPVSNEVSARRKGEGKQGEDDEDLLYEDIQRFRANIRPIADALSSRLSELESSLCVLSDIALGHGDGDEHDDGDEVQTKIRSTQGHLRASPNLHESIQTQLSRLSDLRNTLIPTSLTTLTTTLQHLLTLQRQLLQLQIQHLETSKHGVLSRYTMSKIAFLDTVAQAMALKVQVLVLEARKEVEFSPQAERRKAMTREKMIEAEKEEGELDDRISLLEGVLREYEAVDPGLGAMGKLGGRYREIEQEIQGVKEDIEILEARVKG
ncbi:uncharacterized protein Z519_06118 [Cladophialophora bantiana CBS 173.52]|uniref:Uncharacterized protein n=1 Tax=Cladophialophora bantiana (strain ATCC 10958 / CBS 173.52 / CDC B-1940 / NIH 8579) TaxID=1442370 RepID=A0A0D2HJT4_CLAB1|nr:uncharacterized protein Z519_06118 [Cladophialophora bantiana CBS 173.52]KIW93513.1 hypothetical protein Z519_06118 [Cladophialophora bantiana CBS 173.52]